MSFNDGKPITPEKQQAWRDYFALQAADKTAVAVINFYSTQKDYGCFSNFSRHRIKLNGEEWLTSEHYFQAQKFAGTHHEKKIRDADKELAP